MIQAPDLFLRCDLIEADITREGGGGKPLKAPQTRPKCKVLKTLIKPD